MARSPVRRRTVRTLAALPPLLLVTLVVGRYGTGNQGTVIAGRVYRSAQLSARGLSRAIRDHRVRTVINLRGMNPDQAWYRQERAATLSAGATQVDVPLASDHWLSREQARTLVELIDTCEPPLLVHCEWGAERTGLVSAFVVLSRPGGSIAEALDQFNAWYLFLPVQDGRRMRGHVLAYQRWLTERGLAHCPERFRRWIRSEYRPGHPSREDWPYDPYPLYVVTRPPKAADRLAGRPVPLR